MGKKNRLIKVVTVGTAIAISNITLAAAKTTPVAEGISYHPAKTKDTQVSRKDKILRTAQSAFPGGLTLKQNLKPVDFQTLLADQRLAQAQFDSPEVTSPEIIKPAQEPIPSTEELNPSGNPLSFPTKSDEVKLDAQQPITLEQAIELSLKNNKDIEVARIQIESDAAALRQEKAALFPTLGLSTGFDYSDDAFLDSNLQQSIDSFIEGALENGATEEEAQEAAEANFGAIGSDASTSSFTFNGGLTLNYDIFTSGLRGASIRAAEKTLQNTELQLEVIVEEARQETSSNYYNLQNADAQVEISKAAVQDAAQTLKDAQLLERAGLGTRFDVLRAEVELSQAQQSLSTAKANQNIARRQLAETLSVSHDTDLATADAIEEAGEWEMELEETIVQAFKNRAELEQFLLQKEINEEQRTIALSSIRPTVSANASYSANEDFEDDFDISDTYSAGITLQWQLFDGGAASAGARQAEKGAEIAETSFANERNEIRFG